MFEILKICRLTDAFACRSSLFKWSVNVLVLRWLMCIWNDHLAWQQSGFPNEYDGLLVHFVGIFKCLLLLLDLTDLRVNTYSNVCLSLLFELNNWLSLQD